MARTDIYGKRTLVVAQITPGGGSIIPYGFMTNVDATEYSPLGVSAAVAGALVVIGSNLPKPTRMGKKQTGYSVSCFASSGSIDSAVAAGWKVVKVGKRYRHNAGNTLSTTATTAVSVYVPVRLGTLTIKYAWRIPRYQAAKITTGDATELGIIVPANDNDARDMMFGVNNVKPARASLVVNADNKTQNVTTFYDSNATLAKWKPVSALMVKGASVEF